MNLCRHLVLCLSHLDDTARESPPLPAPVPTRSPPTSFTTLRPGITVVVCALTITFSLTFLLLLYAKHCKRSDSAIGGGDTSNLTAYAAAAAPGRHSGTARAVVESLPAFRFAALQGRHKEGLECAVCLNRFEPADVLRLLPKCRHAFHLECVDVWLDAHSTCPLCRSRVDPEDVLLVADEPRRSKGGGDPPPQSGRRISGRHSSALEISSCWNTIGRRSEIGRRSADSAATRARVRKDGLLLAEGESVKQRFGHRIVVSGCGGGGAPERWSDLMPSDLLFLHSEMIITDSGGGGGASITASSPGRCASEITGVSRYDRRCGGGGGVRGRGTEQVERTMSRWLGWARSGDRDNGTSGGG